MKKNKKSEQQIIPQFHLYGESNKNIKNDVEFIHLEDIETRSKKNAWLIAPHRHSHLFQILCIYKGNAEIKLDEKQYCIDNNWAVLIPSGTVHGFHFSPNTQGVVLTFAEHILTTEKVIKEQGAFEHLLQAPNLVSFNQNTPLFSQLQHYIEQIKIEFTLTEKHYNLTTEWLVKIALITIGRQLEYSQKNTEPNRKNSRILTTFKELLEQNVSQQWSVKEYASQLNTSTSTLNRLCNEMTGTSTKKLIQQRLMLEIKRRIIYTQESLEQIAYRLGFKDVGYFSRFFKLHEGVAPKKYRQDKS